MTTQVGAQFRLSWTLDTAEAVEIRRTVPTPVVFLATVESGVTTFVDTLDTVDPGDTVTYTLTGVTSADVAETSVTVSDLAIPPLDDDRRFQAALLLASRLYSRIKSPLGVAGGSEFGVVRVGFKDPDVEMLLVGLRRSTTDLSTQTWPTVAELRTYVKAGSGVADVELEGPLASAILIVTRRCQVSNVA